MKCTVCRHGDTRPGFVDVSLQREKAIVVIRKTPAEVCENCGEYYLSEEATRRVLQQAAAERGVEVEIVGYAA